MDCSVQSETSWLLCLHYAADGGVYATSANTSIQFGRRDWRRRFLRRVDELVRATSTSSMDKKCA